MSQIDRFPKVIATYRKHGWELRRVLMTAQTRAEATEREQELFEKLPVDDALFDALWFARPSPKNREAWELRLISETPYALFETFEVDESEERRNEVRHVMEAWMSDYTKGHR